MLKQVIALAGLAGLALGQTTGAPTMAPTHDCGCTGMPKQDITRIEYQIPIDQKELTGNVPDRIENFLEYLDSIIEDQMFHGVFDIKKDKSKEYYRSDRTKEMETSDRNNPLIPRLISIKYRQTIDVNGFINEKYQNDFTFQTPVDQWCQCVQPTKEFDGIFKCKNEANMFADETWCDPEYDGMQSLDYWRDGGNGFSGRLEFDDDPMYGFGDNDAVTVVKERTFINFPYDCGNTQMDDFFIDICQCYMTNLNDGDMLVKTDKDVVNFVRDVEFEINREIGGIKTQVSQGKLTFQVRFDTMADARNQRPTGRETELSVKADMAETMDGEWDYVVDVCNQVVDAITQCGYPYIRYSDCPRVDNPPSCPTAKPSMSPTFSPGYIPMCCEAQEGKSRRWQRNCPGYLTQSDCTKGKRGRNCQWATC